MKMKISSRTFVVYPEPSFIDPCGLTKVVEIVSSEDGSTKKHVDFSTTKPLRELLDKMDEEHIQREAARITEMEVLDVLGIPFSEYLKKKIDRRMREV